MDDTHKLLTEDDNETKWLLKEDTFNFYVMELMKMGYQANRQYYCVPVTDL